jgi:hypothetical protein
MPLANTNTFPKTIAAFMERYGINPDEVWQVRPGAWAIKHSALERVAAAEKLIVEEFEVLALDLPQKMAAIRVIATSPAGARVITTGEATPYNSKNAYPLAIAEKRALDRAYLKLLSIHADIYSDAEADDFADPIGGEKGKLLPSSQYARNECEKLMLSMRNCNSIDMLEAWGKAHREEIRAQPEKFAGAIREAYSDLADELRNSAG